MNEITQNKKYNDILAASKTLFWKYGFKKVSIEEICKEAKTSKVTFYKFFSNKLEVAKAVFDFVVDVGISQFKLVLEEATDASVLMRQMLQMKKEGINDISKEFVSDFYSNPELGLKDYIDEKTRLVMAEIINDFKVARERGLLRKDLNLEFLLYLSQKFIDMLEDPVLLLLFPNPQDLIMELTRFSTYGISPHD